MHKRYVRMSVPAVLSGAAMLTATTAPHAAEKPWTAVNVVNGTFASPELTPDATVKSDKEQLPADWSAGPGSGVPRMLSRAYADYPGRARQAVSLTTAKPVTVRTRLWGVHKGAPAKVHFSDSPSTYKSCEPADVKDGQRLRVAAYRELPRDVTGAPGTGADKKPVPREELKHQDYRTRGVVKEKGKEGPGAWSEQPETFEFTAAEDNPLVTFTSLEENKNQCGPLVTGVTAEQQAVDIPHSIPQNDMPGKAYKLHDETKLSDAVTACKAKACRFNVDKRYSYQYYEPVRILGYALLNCTRNPKKDDRELSYTEESFDSISQQLTRIGDPNTTVKKPDNTGADDPANSLDENNAATGTGAPSNVRDLFGQVQAGFQRAEGNTNLANTTNPLTPTRTTRKAVDQTVQPGEASWIEVQASRERIAGRFVQAASPQYSIDAMLDFPSGKVPDRLYERTGPMTRDEQAHCATERPLRVTPDNGGVRAAAPDSGRGDTGLLRVRATPGDRVTRRVPLTGAQLP